MKNVAIFMAVVILLIGVTTVLKFCGNAADTTYKQFSPSALLKKYEYYKDMSAKIDEKRATIQIYEAERKDYPHDSFIYQQRTSEMLGLKAVYNSLCAEYNASMAKFNYAFCNVGTLPASNLEPLPREFKPYILQ